MRADKTAILAGSYIFERKSGTMDNKQNRNTARWIISVVVFLSGTTLAGLIIHLIWMLSLWSAGFGNERSFGFDSPFIVILYFFSLFLIAPFGGLFAAKFWLKRTRM